MTWAQEHSLDAGVEAVHRVLRQVAVVEHLIISAPAGTGGNGTSGLGSNLGGNGGASAEGSPIAPSRGRWNCNH